jgi:proteasome lid subunit RPN8/RPN11
VDGNKALLERIDLDPTLESRSISHDVLHEICSHALEVAPEECCGLVFGVADGEFSHAIRVTNVMNRMHAADPKAFPRDARHAYYMSEIEYMRAIEEAEIRGQHVSAIYHSHFGQGCYLSSDDLAFAQHPLFPFPSAAQLVVSLLGQRVKEVGIFEPVENLELGFVGRRLEAAR